ncbi:MAG: DNA-directed RNA polymerase subunit RpoH/Rpb5 C-terminal domain-containing protein [Candidatus Micrarchaeota archaeon]|nr:DNA-directed RNA polymerase subunit RpoH/Rpb5 C-terminal domain-containing protein [Candidatus Micrarchaeota archaeon]
MVKRKKVKTEGIDVLSHVLVPEMKILSTEEKNRVLKKYNITKWQLPRLLVSDSSMVALKASVDDVVEINRSDLTGKSTCYKLVIDG